jgi:Protein of unknown function (DUF3810)
MTKLLTTLFKNYSNFTLLFLNDRYKDAMMHKVLLLMKSYLGIVMGLLTLMVHSLSMWICTDCFFRFYEKVVFPSIRFVYDYTIGYLPFPFVYIVFCYLIYLIYKTVYKYVHSQQNTRQKLKLIAKGLMNFLGWVIFLFYFSWGFNYYQSSIEKQLALPDLAIDSVDVMSELAEMTILLNDARSKISKDTSKLEMNLDWTSLEQSIRTAQEDMISTWRKPTHGRVRIRALRPQGLLLRFSTAGIYIPFAFEGHVDPGMNQIQWPFTMAHEMAHGYGYTDEGACNFIGFLTCMRSDVPEIRYSGLMGYWRYLFFDIRNRNPELAKQTYETLTKGVKNDLKAIREDLNKYPDLMPVIRDKIYDSYLKSHGVSSGLQSYNEITIQVLRWKKSKYAFSFINE